MRYNSCLSRHDSAICHLIFNQNKFDDIGVMDFTFRELPITLTFFPLFIGTSPHLLLIYISPHAKQFYAVAGWRVGHCKVINSGAHWYQRENIISDSRIWFMKINGDFMKQEPKAVSCTTTNPLLSNAREKSNAMRCVITLHISWILVCLYTGIGIM